MKGRNHHRSGLFAIIVSLSLFAFSVPVQAAKEPTFRIGFIYPRTGPLAPYGSSLSDGLKLGLQQFRERNPQLGRQVGVVVADDGSLASSAEKAAERLIKTQKVHVVVGSLSNTINLAIAAVTSKNQSLLILPHGTDESLLSDPMTFSLTPTDRRQGSMMARFALRQLRRDRAVVLSDSLYPDSEAIGKGFAEAFDQGGGQTVAQWRIEVGKTHLQTLMQELAATQANLIVYPGSYLSLKPLIEAARNAGLKATWLGSDGWDHPDLYRLNPNLGAQYYFSYFSGADPHAGVQNFLTDFEALYGHKPDALAAYGYEAITVVLEAYAMTHTSDHGGLLKALEGGRLGAIYGAGRFGKDRVFLHPSPFLVTAGNQGRFMGRIELED